MDHRERVIAAFRGDKVDRPPVSVWHHWPGKDHDPELFAQAEMNQQHLFDFDFIKVTPSGMIAVQDWGVISGLPYNDHGEPSVHKFAINSLDDWGKLLPLSPQKGRLAQEVQALGLITRGLKKSAMIFQTIFFPLTNAGKLAGPGLLTDLRENPRVVKKALDVITETTIAFIRACIVEGGADGLFLSTKYGDPSLLTADEYREYALPYELKVLEAIADLKPINILHLHGNDIMFDLFKEFPVDAINWHDRTGKMTIKEAKSFFKQGLIAGLSNETAYLMGASSKQLADDVKDAIAQAEGERISIGPGCVFPQGMAVEKIMAIRNAVE